MNGNKIYVYSSLSGRHIGTYDNVKDLCEELKVEKSNVYRCLKGERKGFNGYYARRMK